MYLRYLNGRRARDIDGACIWRIAFNVKYSRADGSHMTMCYYVWRESLNYILERGTFQAYYNLCE